MRRRLLLAATVVCAALLAAGCASTTIPGTAPAATPSSDSGSVLLEPGDFEATVDETEALLVNVHTPPEGDLPGTELVMPFDEITARRGELPTDLDAPLAIYCKTGRMSATAAATLAGLGYTDVVELAGGMDAWTATGRSLVASSTG